jgi:hypothetical protein
LLATERNVQTAYSKKKEQWLTHSSNLAQAGMSNHPGLFVIR